MASLYVDIDAVTAQFNKKVNQALNKLDSFGSKMDQVGAIGDRMSLIITTPLLAAAGLMTKAASDMQESLGKVDVSFKDSSQEIKDFAKTTLTSFGIAESSALDMAATFGDMATGMGLDTAAAAEMSTTLVGLAGDLASFKNIRLDVANTALKSIFTGETESLKNLGVVMTQASLQNFAMANGLNVSIQNMSEAEKVALRYAFVLEKTANSQGDFQRTGGNFAGQLRVFQEGVKQLSQGFGELLLPAATKVIAKLNGLVTVFDGLNESTKRNILFAGGLVAVLGPSLVALSQVAKLAGSIGVAFGTTAGPVAATIALLVAGATAVYSNWEKVIDLLTSMQESFFQMSLSFGKILLNLGLINSDQFVRATEASAETISMWSDMLGTKPSTVFADSIKDTTSQIEGLLASIKGMGAATDGVSGKSKTVKLFDGISIGSITGLTSSKIQSEKEAFLNGLLDIVNPTTLSDALGGRLEEAGNRIREGFEGFYARMGEDITLKSAVLEQVAFSAFSSLGDALAQGLAGIFNQQIDFNFQNIVSQVLQAVGRTLIGIATPLVAALALGNVATFGGMSVQSSAAIGMLAAGVAMSGGGMALGNTSSVGQTAPIGTGGSFTGAGFSGSPSINVNINGTLKGSGTDLVAVINETNYAYNG